MSAILEVREKTYEVEPGISIRKALQKIGLTPGSYLAVRNGEMVPEDTILKNDDRIKLVAVISGG
jgi:sulfur carrier protein ThiS